MADQRKRRILSLILDRSFLVVDSSQEREVFLPHLCPPCWILNIYCFTTTLPIWYAFKFIKIDKVFCVLKYHINICMTSNLVNVRKSGAQVRIRNNRILRVSTKTVVLFTFKWWSLICNLYNNHIHSSIQDIPDVDGIAPSFAAYWMLLLLQFRHFYRRMGVTLD